MRPTPARPVIAALLTCALWSGAAWASAPAQRGVALGLFSEDPGYSYLPLLKEIKATGASHVSIIVPFYQHDIGSTRIRRHPRYSPAAAVVERTLRQARQIGLEVMLFPILRLEYQVTPQEWRGAIRPRDPAAWWRSYTTVMLQMARVASRHSCAALCVGSELGSMDRDPAPWKRLIDRVRAVYKGKLVYSANWDGYTRARIWHLVDLAGLSAYFQLTADGEAPTLERLIHAWREQRVHISRWRARIKKPLVFTELGYHSQKGASARPWDESALKGLSLQEQAACYRAFTRVWSGVTYLQGVYFWNWFGWGGPRSKEYCPRGKPAAKIICGWYGAKKGKCPRRWGIPR